MANTLLALSLAGATAVAAAGFSTECTDVSVTDYWLVGTCPDDNGGEITSSVFLPYKLSNQNGNLEWTVDGKYYQSCSDCSLSGATFSCSCRDATNHVQDTSINLEEHIAVYAGHLFSNQTGSIPDIPTNLSTPVPSDFSGTIALTTLDDTCSRVGLTASLNSPSECFYANLGPVITYLSGATTNNQGWEVKFYSDLECTSEVVATFTEDNDGDCLAFEGGAQAWSVIPLWNADWSTS
ncbi:Cyanovirin-N [Aspergillus heterothallicus]